MKYFSRLKLAAFTFFFSTALAHANGGCGGHGGHVSAFLVSVAAGYWVLTLSQKETSPLGGFGRALGALILIVALGGLLLSATCAFFSWRNGPSGGSCAWTGKARACAYMGRPPDGTSAPSETPVQK